MERINPIYNKRYPSEITYLSDKNFVVRLKAMIERTLKATGVHISSDKLSEVMEIVGNEAEDCLFEKKEKLSE